MGWLVGQKSHLTVNNGKKGKLFFGKLRKSVAFLPFFAFFCQNLVKFPSVYVHASILFSKNTSDTNTAVSVYKPIYGDNNL